MPELALEIGGRSFRVSCNEGEEQSVEKAAALLNSEVKTLTNAAGRLPESHMLLLAGLMVSDKWIAQGEELKGSTAKVNRLEAELRKVRQEVEAGQNDLFAAPSEMSAGGDQAENEALKKELEQAYATIETMIAELKAHKEAHIKMAAE